jgi:hypothetical protein
MPWLLFTSPVWKWTAGLAACGTAALLIVLAFHSQSARHEEEDCDAIYQSIVQPHRSDIVWLKSHVLLNKTEGGRFIASDIPNLLARLPLQERLSFWWEFHSFTHARDGEPLAYSRTFEPRLLVSSPQGLSGFLARGVEVLNFSKPGFSLDHKRAVVFVGVELPNPYPTAPFYHGSLLYFAKVGGHWIRDAHPPALNVNLVT